MFLETTLHGYKFWRKPFIDSSDGFENWSNLPVYEVF